MRLKLCFGVGVLMLASGMLLIGCEGGGIVSDIVPPRPLFSFGADGDQTAQYTCTNGVAQQQQSGAPTGSEVCVRCNLGYVLFGTVCNSRLDIDGDGVDNDADIDRDNDGLIEIGTVEDLYNIRFSLRNEGRVVEIEDGVPVLSLEGVTTNENRSVDFRCSDGEAVCGYELTGNIDFDIDNDGRSWSIAGDSVSLDEGDSSDFFDIARGGWLPIGYSEAEGDATVFEGIFDGNGYTIANMVSSRSLPNIGLFATLSSTAQIGNLLIADAFIEHDGNDAANIGVLAGTVIDRGETPVFDGGGNEALNGSEEVEAASGEDVQLQNGIDNGADADRSNADDADHTNVFADLTTGGRSTITNVQIIDDSIVVGTSFTNAAGGLVGVAERVAIDSTIGDVAIRGATKSGGLVGVLQHGSIRDTSATTDIVGSATSDSLGGLVGEQQGGIILTSRAVVSFEGDTIGRDTIGGLVGYKRGGDISGSGTGGRIHLSSNGDAQCIGGLVGINIAGNIVASGANSNIRLSARRASAGSENEIGGLICSHRDGNIVASYARGEIVNETQNSTIGGIVGSMEGGTMLATANAVRITHTLTGTNATGAIGGVVGTKRSGTVTASYSDGAIRVTPTYSGSIGGLIGMHSAGTVESSYATVNITNAPPNTGALIGLHNPDSTVHRASYGFGSRFGSNNTDASNDTSDSGALTPLANAPRVDVEDAERYRTERANSLTAAHLDNHPAWGTERMPPLLYIVDYDGDSATSYSCNMFPQSVVAPTIATQTVPLVCGGDSPSVVGRAIQ